MKPQIKGIVQGYKNALLKNNPQVEAEATRRLAICQNCPLRKITMGIQRCGVCGCPLSGLTRQNQKICKNWKR